MQHPAIITAKKQPELKSNSIKNNSVDIIFNNNIHPKMDNKLETSILPA